MGMVNAQDVMAFAGVQAAPTADLLKMPGSGQMNTTNDDFASVLQKTTQFSISVSVNSSEKNIAGLVSDNKQPEKLQNKDTSPEDKTNNSKADIRNENAKVKSDNSQNTDKTTDSKDTISEKMEKAGEKLVKEVSEEMGVDEEEVVKVMELLGLTAIDLLQPENMADVVNALVEQVEELPVVENGELFDVLDNLMNMSEEESTQIAEEIGLNEEQFDNILTGKAFEGEIKEVSSDKPENIEPKEKVDVFENSFDEKAFDLNKVKDSQSKDSGTTDNSEGSKPEYFGTITQAARRENVGTLNHNDNMMNSFWNQLLDKVNDSISNLESLQEADLVHTSARDIIDQIQEFIKVSVDTDVTKMEMQLHPQSLGNIGIMLAATKDGNMVAEFTTQNETVRDAILSQIAQLQKQFNEQGLKVTEITVMVETHAFEQNLEQNEHQAGNEENTGKKTRRINLGDLSLDIDDEMDDADKLVAEMMAANGNTIDYTA